MVINKRHGDQQETWLWMCMIVLDGSEAQLISKCMSILLKYKSRSTSTNTYIIGNMGIKCIPEVWRERLILSMV